MLDIRDNHGAMSSFRARGGVRIRRAASGSFSDQQRLLKALLAAVRDNPLIDKQASERGLPQRATKSYAITDRVQRMRQDDIEQAIEVLKTDHVEALAFVFGTAKQRVEMVELSQDLVIAG